jgi:hypothetical protein
MPDRIPGGIQKTVRAIDEDSDMTSRKPSSQANRLRIPNAMRATADEVIAITDAFCEQLLDQEYAELCRRLAARLARKRPSPLTRGRPKIWAAGVIYAIGSLNFLFDRAQHPHMNGDELADSLDVAKSTMANKAALIRRILDLRWFEPELMRREMLEHHPVAWLIEVNGLVVDARWLPPEIQDEARRRGLIPDIAQPVAS